MTTFEITALKPLMNQLLAGDTFDSFLLEESTICTALTYTVDGHINTAFYPAEERGEECLPYEFQPWSDIKGLFFDLIKGKHTPLSFKFVLHYKPEQAASLLAQAACDVDTSLIRALVLTVKYDGSKANITTGISYNTFVMSKEPDAIWDKAVAGFLTEKGISFEIP
ncbi:MAG: hypothetical protein J1E64_03495 [Acetatifactor sp.]|nr:hypothetical protein [Acetatifactor sp.]